MRPRYAICERRSASWCSSWTREKNWQPCPETRDHLLTVQGQMRTEGKVVAIAQLCRWFGVPRSTFYYRGERRRAAELDRDLVELVGRLIAANPEYGLRRLTVLVRRELREAVNRKRIHRILKGNGWQIRQRPRGLGLAGRAAERSVGHRCDARLLWSRRLVSSDSDHRLL